MALRIFIGWDSREAEAYAVAEKTARVYGCETIPLIEERLRSSGMLTRPVDRRGPARAFDFNSNAEQSTDFANSRFFVPLLAHSGWALFVDADVVFMQDPHGLMSGIDGTKALYVVKHMPMELATMKMDGQKQLPYARKLWSSVTLWNCDHPANRRLNLTALNQLPGRDLHRFCWLADSEIGELPAEANWLVNIQPKPARPVIAHYTEGGPWIDGWIPREHDEIWLKAKYQ